MKGRRKEKLTQLGPYRLTAELGRGAMGVVYRAVNEKLDREVALKVIAPERDLTPEALGRFQREAKAAAALSDHPGIVGCHDIGEAEGRVYFAMDLVEGPSLERLIEKDGLTVEQTLRIMADAARAVHYAHQHRILHRDIKPGNILTTKDGDARVADFGLAKTQAADEESMKLTKSGALIGTPAYMAPEQSFGDRIDERADVYALGATLYHALAGETPFPADSLYSLLAKIQKTDPEPVRRLNTDVPVDVETIVAKCLEKEPDRRYQSAEELADDLDRARMGESIMAKPPGMISLVVRKAKRRKGIVIASAVGLTGFIVLAAVLIPQITSAETAAEKAQRKAAEAAAEAKRLQKEADEALARAKRTGRKIREAEMAASRAAREARAAKERAAGAGAAAEMGLKEAREAAEEALQRATDAEKRERKASEAAAKAREELAAFKRKVAAGAVDTGGAAGAKAPKSSMGYLRASAETAITAMGELRRAGVPGPMGQFLPLVAEAARDALALDPESGAPHLWLARAHRTNFDDAAALDELNLAIAQEPGLREARRERLWIGMRRAVAAHLSDDEAGRDAIAGLLKQDLADLEKAGALQGAALDLARGLVALAAGDAQKAQGELTRALQSPGADPFAANEAMARTLGLLDRPDDAAVYWGKVVEADAGYIPARMARGFFTLAAARADLVANRAQIEQVLGDYDTVLSAMPDHVDARLGRARALQMLGSSIALEKPLRPAADWNHHFVQSMELYDALEGRTPEAFKFHRMRGIVAFDWAVFLGRDNRGDPVPVFERAIADLTRDVEASANDLDALMSRGRAYFEWANWMRVNHKPDPRVNLDAARADFEAALKIESRFVPARQAIADCLIIRATFAEKYDENPDPLLREAVKVYKALARQNPQDINAWHGLAGAWLWRARIEQQRKKSTAKERKEAIDAWARVLRINPGDFEAQKETAKAWLRIGEELAERGKDPRKPLREACAAFERTLELKGDGPVNWSRLAQARRLLAVALGPKDKASDATFQLAHDALSKALEFDDGNAGFWRQRGEVNWWWARTQELRRKNAGEAWKRGYADLTKALALGAKGDDLQKMIKQAEAGMAKHGVKK